MRKLIVSLAALGLLGIPALAAHAALPTTGPGSCNTAAGQGSCTFTSGPAQPAGAMNATGVISESTSFTITAAASACAMKIPPPSVPGPALPTPPVGTLSTDGLTYTGTNPGAAAITYVTTGACTYTLTVNVGAAEAGQTN